VSDELETVEPANAGEDHATDPELLTLYEALEASGMVTPGDPRSVTEQVRSA
jgi:hypothetical protein